MLRWLQGDRSTLTSLTSSLTGSQSSLVEVAAVAQESGGDSCCCPNTSPEKNTRPCPSPSVSTQCSASFEDSDDISDQAWSAVSSPIPKITSLHGDGPADHTGLTAVLEGSSNIDCNDLGLIESFLSSHPGGLAQSRDVKGEEIEHSEGGPQSAQEEPELSLGQSEALLGYDTHWCWVESKDDVTFL